VSKINVSHKDPGKIKSPLDLIINNPNIENDVEENEDSFSSQLKGGIYEVSFRYNANLGGYTTLMPDRPELYAIAFIY